VEPLAGPSRRASYIYFVRIAVRMPTFLLGRADSHKKLGYNILKKKEVNFKSLRIPLPPPHLLPG
jgi:hypothetical protein